MNVDRHQALPRTGDVLALPDLPMRLTRRLLAAGLRTHYHVTSHNPEFVPRTGPVLLASNHVGYLDGPLLVTTCLRPVHAMVKREMYVGRLGMALTAAGQIPLTRRHVDPRAVKLALRALRDDKVVAIYPEGTRGPGDGQFVKPGLAYLALVTGAPVVPVAVLGTRDPGQGIDWLPPRGQRIEIVYGEPVLTAIQPWPRRRHDVQALTSELQKLLIEHIAEAIRFTGVRLPGRAPNQEGPERGSVNLAGESPSQTAS
ncbi:MAG: 1-acyl-sn-glycerol-3-phosphate acyltransferase [Nocardioidaceae bacterium]|nr:1-acyl-sn-glycerol-3-phosphate acyltransferase [Nocardioidaceae bacterium]